MDTAKLARAAGELMALLRGKSATVKGKWIE